MQENKIRIKTIGGMSLKLVLVPFMVVLLLLHISVIILVINSNSKNQAQLDTINNSNSYRDEVTNILAGYSQLSELSSNFITKPIVEDGNLNLSVLIGYYSGLNDSNRNPDLIYSRTLDFNVSEKVHNHIKDAIDGVKFMIAVQLHSLALVDSVYKFPNIQPINTIQLPELSAEEQALSNDDKLEKAKSLLLNGEYLSYRGIISSNVNISMDEITRESNEFLGIIQSQIEVIKVSLWVDIIVVIILFTILVIIIYFGVINPLDGYSRHILSDEKVNDRFGLREVRLVGNAYNELLIRRDALESLLRTAAETDSLTNLSNRYAFDKYLSEFEDEDISMCIILFDVNYLKRTNDTYGHAAGDELLKLASKCIVECFGREGENNCFRFGGDEFAAVIPNIDEKEYNNLCDAFSKKQKEFRVSISYGGAWTSSYRDTTAKALLDAADDKLYELKKIMHIKRR